MTFSWSYEAEHLDTDIGWVPECMGTEWQTCLVELTKYSLREGDYFAGSSLGEEARVLVKKSLC